MNPIIAINYYFTEDDLRNQIFSPESKSMLSPYMRAFREYMAERNVDVVTLDTVDFSDPNVKAVLYFEYNWRMLSDKRDPFLKNVPYEKRALVLLEPAIVNPTMYYTNLIRRRFKTVFTWDLRLQKKHKEYVPIRVPTGADPTTYRENPFVDIPFSSKKLVVAVSRNRWHYMPQSTFGLRRKIYRYLQKHAPDDFDLFGLDWEKPCSRWERFLGRDYRACWRGEIPGGWDAKTRKIANYRFSICFENSVWNPGYISEKIFDCFCARSVPVYLGSKGNEKLLPHGAYIDYRDFNSPRRLLEYLKGVGEAEYRGYIEHIDAFLASDETRKFTTADMYRIIFERLIGGNV